jgi:hypothetical protein
LKLFGLRFGMNFSRWSLWVSELHETESSNSCAEPSAATRGLYQSVLARSRDKDSAAARPVSKTS